MIELDRSGPEYPVPKEPEPRRTGLWVGLIVLLLAAVGGGGYWYWSTHQPAPVVEAPPPPPAPAAAPEAKVNLAEGDALLRHLAAGLSSSRELAAWLSEGDIVRRLVAATNLVAEGKSPRPVLGFLAPTGDFETAGKKDALHASPKAIARYDQATRVVTSIDPMAAGPVFAQLRPFLDAAWAEIGPPGSRFDAVLHQAIGQITSVPVPASEPVLQEHGALYVYADPALEQLSAAQKQLLRMGAANATTVQGWLKKLDVALSASAPATGGPATAPKPERAPETTPPPAPATTP